MPRLRSTDPNVFTPPDERAVSPAVTTVLAVPMSIDPEGLALIARCVADLLPVDAVAPTERWPEWMSVESASRYLDISVERLRKLKERRQVPYYQEGPGTRVFFRRPELDEWMSGFRHGIRVPQ